MIENKTIDVLIPARGGSKGIPKKNIVDICGHPLISYSIKAALESSFIDQVFVSSDNLEILEISQKFGANTLLRNPSLASDSAPTDPTLLEFAHQSTADIIVLLQATSPLILSSDLDKGLAYMLDCDSVISVTNLTQFIWSDGVPNYDLQNRPRRQDIPASYLETGAFFISTRCRILQSRNRISGSIGFITVPKLRSVDIDDYDDLELVRSIVSLRNSSL